MNRDAMQHPPKDQLEAYGRGKLDEAQSSRIEKHLDECEDCTGTVVNLKDDTFIKLVRETPRAEADPPEEPAANRASAGPTTPDATIAIDAAAPTSTGRLEDLPRELREHPRYEVLELIGRGGMGDVYKAQHRVMNRTVALKVIKPEMVQNEEAVKRFRREVQAAARLHHKNIVTAHDAEQAGDLHFLVMEYADGVDLDEFVRRRGAMAVDQACECISQAAEGLQYAHELGMVHRDIKPHNLMLTRGGKLKILDFGLASFASETAAEDKVYPSESEETSSSARSPQLTRSGSMMGTPDFISPEQALDAHTADIRADIYSLGCTFYKLLTGKPPFEEGSVMDKIHAHSRQRAAPLSEFRDDVPAEVQAVLLKMMAKLANGRYQQPREVVEALSRHRNAEALPLPPVPARPAPSRRKPIMLAAVATMLISAILAGIIFYVQTNVGTVRVEVADESLAVTLAGNQITMRDGETPVAIRPGEQSLVVRRGEFEFETDAFEIRRGDDLAIKVELLAGEIVVRNEHQVIGSQRLPQELAQAYRTTWTPLFNGKDLTGWKTTTDYPNKWIVKDGVLTTTGATNARLFSERGDYENFHLRAEVRLSETGNSGVYFRSEFGYGFSLERIGGRANGKAPLGLEADLVAVSGPTSGGLGPAGTVYRLGETEDDLFRATSHEVKPDTWFTFELIADDRQVTVKINGKLVNRFEADGSYTAGGHIALAATRGRVEYRKIEISEIVSTAPAQPIVNFKPLFNGKDLTGWKPHPQMPGNWRVENGAIVGSGDTNNAFLVTERSDFEDFHLRVEARINSAAADSGIVIDYTDDWKFISEITISCDPQKQTRQTGSMKVYRTELDWIKAPLGMTFPQEWFVMEVIAQGNTITSKINGKVAVQVRHRHENVKGAIMLQQYGPATVVEFRKIEISEMDSEKISSPIQAANEIALLGKVGEHRSKIEAIAVGSQGLVATTDDTGHLAMWDTNPLKSRGLWKAHQQAIWDAQFTPAGDQIVTVGNDRVLRWWDPQTTKPLGHINLFEVEGSENLTPRSVSISADGRYAAICGHSSDSVWIHDLDSKELVRPIKNRHGLSIHFVDRGRKLLTTNGDALRLLDTQTGEQLWQTSEAELRAIELAISADGQLFAAGGRKGALAIYKTSDGSLVKWLIGHAATVNCLDFTADGQHLVTGSDDMTIRLWNVASGEEVARGVGPSHCFNRLAILPDGKTVLSGGGGYYDDAAKKYSRDSDYGLYQWQLPESAW